MAFLVFDTQRETEHEELCYKLLKIDLEDERNAGKYLRKVTELKSLCNSGYSSDHRNVQAQAKFSLSGFKQTETLTQFSPLPV